MKKIKKHRRSIIAIVVMLTALVLFLGAVHYAEDYLLLGDPGQTVIADTEANNLTEVPAETESTIPNETTMPDETTTPVLPEYSLDGKEILNILLIGEDQWDNEDYGRSDTMILVQINAKTDTVTMTSFLRDLYLPIPGYGSNRLNASYAWGGTELLNETLTGNFGVQIDGTIEVGYHGFIYLIDQLGGVDVTLTPEEAAYMTEHGGARESEKWQIQEGPNHLDGNQALAYSRIRFIDSDFVRTQRQRTVLIQILEKFQSMHTEELLEIINQMLEQSTTSFTNEELLLYALGFFPVLTDCEIATQQIPAEGTYKYATVRGMSVIQADIEENAEILKELLMTPN